MRCSNLHLPNAMMELRLKQLTDTSAYCRCINSQDLRLGRFLIGSEHICTWCSHRPTVGGVNFSLDGSMSYDRTLGYLQRHADPELSYAWSCSPVSASLSSKYCDFQFLTVAGHHSSTVRKASPTSWGREESASSSLIRCSYIPYSCSFSAYRIIHLLLSHSKFPAYFKNRSNSEWTMCTVCMYICMYVCMYVCSTLWGSNT